MDFCVHRELVHGGSKNVSLFIKLLRGRRAEEENELKWKMIKLSERKNLFGTTNLPSTFTNLRNNQPLLLHVPHWDTWSLCGNFQLLMPEAHVVAFDNIVKHELKFFFVVLMNFVFTQMPHWSTSKQRLSTGADSSHTKMLLDGFLNSVIMIFLSRLPDMTWVKLSLVSNAQTPEQKKFWGYIIRDCYSEEEGKRKRGGEKEDKGTNLQNALL